MLKINSQVDIQKTTQASVLPDNIRRTGTLTDFVPKQGQHVVVELIKILSENRVLVQTLPEKNSQVAPQTIDIDVSTLAKKFIPGQKLMMDIVSDKPLKIQFSSYVPATREQLILDRIRQLLPSQSTPIDLNKLVDSFKNETLPASIHKEVHKLIQSSLSKTEITQPHVFKQALASSGTLMENQLLKQPSQSKGDFKANILKILKAVETVISETKELGTDKVVNKLPAQVQSALLSSGKTATQVMNILLTRAASSEFQASILTAGMKSTDLNKLPEPIRTALLTLDKILPQLNSQLLSESKPASSGSQASRIVDSSHNADLSKLSEHIRSVLSTLNKILPQLNIPSLGSTPASALTGASVTSELNKLPEQIRTALLTLDKVLPQLKNSLSSGNNSSSLTNAQASVLTESSVSSELNKLPDHVRSALSILSKISPQLISSSLSGSTAASSGNQTAVSAMTSQQALSLLQLLQQSFASIPNQKTVNGHVPMEIKELVQLFRGLEGVHNKLQLNQLTMLKEPEVSSTVASWLFDVPIKDKQALDLLQVQIDQNTSQSEKEESDTWDVKLRLDTQNLGPVQANVIFQDDDVKVIITAERSESTQLLEENIELLVDAISKLGVTVSLTQCNHGNIDAAVSEAIIKSPTSLLDISV